MARALKNLNVCPTCNGTGAVFYEIDEILSKKLELHDKGKISTQATIDSIYEYLFIKFGFTPSIGEASQMLDITSVEAYSRVFLPKIQAVGAKYLRGKENGKASRDKRKLLVIASDDKTITLEATEELIKKQDHKCAICNKGIVPRGDRHLDHISPLSKGGEHTIKNVQWLCVSCNVHKSNKINFSL
jgi:predicted methyltransferase